jgi:hypothetical protein
MKLIDRGLTFAPSAGGDRGLKTTTLSTTLAFFSVCSSDMMQLNFGVAKCWFKYVPSRYDHRNNHY